VTLTELSLQVKWLKNLAQEDRSFPISVTPPFCDNNSTINRTKDPISSDRTKHIEVRHCKVQELVEANGIEVTWIPTEDQVADVHTKPMANPASEKCKIQLQVLVKTEDQVKTAEVKKTYSSKEVSGHCS
jgi:hypothetical protein